VSRFQLQSSTSGLRLADTQSRQHPLQIDFVSGQFSYRLRKGGRKQELLAKAVGIKQGLSVLDCTAGLGRDSFLLASMGCEVTMLERSKVMAMLLEDALRRAENHDDLKVLVDRVRLVHADAIGYLATLECVPDVIMLDPMFPTRKKSAHVKGEMQVLQRFLGSDGDIEDLVAAARATSCKRLVVKRPVFEKSEMSPTFSLKGSSTRFDVFVR
jgi:16S rRNA (guanine1516-N2)-methyltransferase